MPSLIDVKNRIAATRSTKKITKAMQLVAASKMKHFQRTATDVRRYALSLVRNLALAHGSMDETVYAERRTAGKTVFVLLASDKGLCGAMNTQLVRALLRSERWRSTPTENRALITVGRKSKDAARAEGIVPLRSFERLPERLRPHEALEVIGPLLSLWESGEAREIIVVSPWYVNPFVFHPEVKTFLPYSAAMVAEHLHTEELPVPMAEAAIFEPTAEEVVLKLARAVAESLFIEAFYELKATEYSSRMVAMKKATEAADERIDTLTIEYNKARQGAITQQLAELASASEAMAGEDAYETFDI